MSNYAAGHKIIANYYSNPSILLPQTNTPTGLWGVANNARIITANRYFTEFRLKFIAFPDLLWLNAAINLTWQNVKEQQVDNLATELYSIQIKN